MIGPHLGNWEIGAAKLADLGLPVAAVYRGLRQPALELVEPARPVLETRKKILLFVDHMPRQFILQKNQDRRRISGRILSI